MTKRNNEHNTVADAQDTQVDNTVAEQQEQLVEQQTVETQSTLEQQLAEVQRQLAELKAAQVQVRVVNKSGTMIADANSTRKSDRVRAKIAEAKRNGKDYAAAVDGIVDWATAELGMQKALAKTYVKNNWVVVNV